MIPAGLPTLLAALPATVPLTPDRGEARRLAVRELAGGEYARARPNLIQRAVEKIFDFLDRLDPGAGSGLGLAVGLGVIALVVAIALVRYGSFARTAGRLAASADVLGGTTRSAAEHRAEAEARAAAGAWTEAVVERFRAVARELEERTVVVPQPGRTADELALAAAGPLPHLAGDLHAAARTFDEVCYGGRPGGPEPYGRIAALDTGVRRARTVSTVTAAAPAGPVVPS